MYSSEHWCTGNGHCDGNIGCKIRMNILMEKKKPMSFKLYWQYMHSRQLYVHHLPLSIGCMQWPGIPLHIIESYRIAVRVADHYYGHCLCVFAGDAPAVWLWKCVCLWFLGVVLHSMSLAIKSWALWMGMHRMEPTVISTGHAEIWHDIRWLEQHGFMAAVRSRISVCLCGFGDVGILMEKLDQILRGN